MYKEKKIIKTDKKRLYAAFNRRGLSGAAASREIGYSDNYFAMMLRECGGLTERAAIFIESFFGITRDEYEVKEPAETALAPPAIPESVDPAELPDILKMTKDEIHDLLYSAIVKAILDALE